MKEKIPEQCYLHPHIEKRWVNDEIGWGLFATRPIRRLEVTTKITGIVMPQASSAIVLRPHLIKFLERYSIEIDDNVIAYPDSYPPYDVYYMNHSCNPNVGNKDAFTTIAMREIEPGEQITYDYATTDTDDIFYRGEMECRCGEPNCRKIITGDDWMKPELQEKYQGYFQPHIQRKIDALKQTPE